MKKIVTLFLVLAILAMTFGVMSFAEETPRIEMDEESFLEEDPITFTIYFPEDRGANQADWVGIYRADVDESNIYDGAGLDIWCYVVSNTRSYMEPDSDVYAVEMNGNISGGGNWPLAPGEYKILLFYEDGFTVAASCPFTVEEYVEPTPRATEIPTETEEAKSTKQEAQSEATETVEPQSTEYKAQSEATPTAEVQTEEETKSGCGSVVSFSTLSLAMVAVSIVIIRKKKI